MINHEQLSAIGRRASSGDPLAPLFVNAQKAIENGEDVISLAIGAPHPSAFPLEMARELLNKSLDILEGRALNYTRPQGFPPLVGAYLKRMGNNLSVDPEQHDVLVTSGGMEAIGTASIISAEKDSTVLAEGPTFPGALSVYRIWGAKVKHAESDEHGMLPAALEAAVKEHKPQVVHVMPDGQNPGGSTMPLDRREQIAGILKKYDIVAIEDGAYRRLRYAEGELPTLQSFAPDNVIFTDSTSKYGALGPSARVGFLVAPKWFTETTANFKSAFNMQASALTQAVMELYLNPDNPYMDEYLPKLVKEYAAKRDAMVAALQKHFGSDKGFSWNVPEAGMFMWLKGPKDIDFEPLAQKAIQNGVAFVPGHLFYVEGSGLGHTEARLNFASAPLDKIDEGIRRLASVAILR